MITKSLQEGNRVVFNYFNAKIAGSKTRADELTRLSRIEKDPKKGEDYLLQARYERRSNAKWAAWQAMELYDPVFRVAAGIIAKNLLEEAYPGKSTAGFRIRHPFIAGRIRRLNEGMEEGMKEIKEKARD